jgi:hypothetical protein
VATARLSVPAGPNRMAKPCCSVSTVGPISDFDGLHSRPHDAMRKASLARLLARHVDGIFLSDFQQGEIALTCFVTPA